MFPRRFAKAGRPGTYLRIVVEGELGAGDRIRIVERPDHDVTIGDFFRIFMRDRDELPRLLSIPRMSDSWTQWVEGLLKEKERRREESADPG